MYKINNSNFQFFSSEKLHHNLSIQLRIPTLPCLPKNAFFPLEYFFALNILSGSFKFSCLTVFWPSLHHRCIQNPVKHLGLSVFAKKLHLRCLSRFRTRLCAFGDFAKYFSWNLFWSNVKIRLQMKFWMYFNLVIISV